MWIGLGKFYRTDIVTDSKECTYYYINNGHRFDGYVFTDMVVLGGFSEHGIIEKIKEQTLLKHKIQTGVCDHNWVNVSFNHIRIVCTKCNTEK